MSSLAKTMQGQSNQCKMYKKGGAVEGSKKDVETNMNKEGTRKEEASDKMLKAGGVIPQKTMKKEVMGNGLKCGGKVKGKK
jgi:hypothetical protein